MSAWFQVVGVLGDVRSFGLSRATPYELYRLNEQDPFASMTVVIPTSGPDPTAIVPTARRVVASIDQAVPISQVQTMEDVVADSVGQPRLMSALTALFGSLAGLLAMVGVYGVMAYNVRRQRREFGIRLALGAEPARVKRLVVARGLVLALVGVASAASAPGSSRVSCARCCTTSSRPTSRSSPERPQPCSSSRSSPPILPRAPPDAWMRWWC